eukprot:scaffold96692_cov15-Tisochrysis_lutea.AAC.1
MASQAPSLSASPLAMWLKPKIPAGRPPVCSQLVDCLWIGSVTVGCALPKEQKCVPAPPDPSP